MVKLVSMDKETFDVEERVAVQSKTIANVISESGTDDSISVQMVPGKVLAKVLQYCKHHADDTGKVVDTDRASEDTEDDTEGDEDAISNWDKEFLDVDQGTLFSIIRAANYLNVAKLLQLAIDSISDSIRGKTPEQIRNQLGIKEEYEPAALAAVKDENQWLFGKGD